MIIYPSIDKLLDKVPSRYSLAVLAAKRAHELEAPNAVGTLEDYKSLKTVGKALEEVAAGDVIIDPDSKHLERDAEALDHKQD